MKAINIYNALILNDYPGAEYAEWVRSGKKLIETRMKRLFKYRGDLVICCGATNSRQSPNAGLAICIVNVYDGRPMIKADEGPACIEWHKDRKALLLKDWRHFNKPFKFTEHKVSGTYQGIFQITLPKFICIIPRPEIKPAYDIEPNLFNNNEKV
jgi:hypothetical protein